MSQSDYHYHVIARALAEIDRAHDDARASGEPASLTLDQLSARLGFSTAHFQRLFSAWVGVSPKRYQQYLALDHAREMLSRRHSVADVAHNVGLSTPSRLHDLFVTWEAMPPGAYAAGGQSIAWGRFDSPFGEVLAFGTAKGLCGLAFIDETGFDASYTDMTKRWPGAIFTTGDPSLAQWVKDAFSAKSKTPLTLIGAPFQIKVWEALLAIPSGHVTTYSDIAEKIGSPKAVRAVGTAVGRNPISLLIPCHRVVRKNGDLGGYHWGLTIKRAMLAHESARAEAGTPSSD